MTSLNKRKFIKQFVYTSIAAALVNVSQIFAAWPKDIFNERSSDRAMDSITSNGDIIESELITIKAPDIAENGGVVPVTVSTKLEKVKNISILVDNNPSPLTSSFNFNERLTPYVSTRVKMAKTSNITAIVTTESGYFKASRSIKVTIGGCGG